MLHSPVGLFVFVLLGLVVNTTYACDCSWIGIAGACDHDDGSKCWSVCCGGGGGSGGGDCTGSLMGSVDILIDGQNATLPVYGGSVTASGNSISLSKNARAYISANKCAGQYDPSMYMNFKLANKKISYTADISKVPCACNAAFYLVSILPGGSAGDGGDFYCDANGVNGEWCPEMDIMEANVVTSASTPHRCSGTGPNNWSNCDGGGCSRNIYKLSGESAFGYGGGHTIDTSKTFRVESSYIMNGDVLGSIITTYSQDGRSYTITHDDACGGGYVAGMTTAINSGMVVTMSLWGSDAATMSWLDQPPCGGESCPDSGVEFHVTDIVVEGA